MAISHGTGLSMIQIVCVKWGDKYGSDLVNLLFRAVRRNTRSTIRGVCITDRPDERFDDGIVAKPFPTFSVPFDTLKRGCRLKLAIFAPGLIDPGLPTIYVDIDTMVRGDMQRIVDQLERKPGIYMLPNHFVQWWPVQKYVRMVAPDRYYFGNSSLLAFIPQRCHFIFDDFNRLIAGAPKPPPKYLASDERFISWAARDYLRVFPRSLAIKFAEEYMAPVAAIEEMRKHLPWVVARRRSVVAVTFVGRAFKPERLVAYKKGEIVRYGRLQHRWDHDEFRDYWRAQDRPTT